MQEWFRSNASEFSGELIYNEPLSKHTYYRIGGPAQVLATPRTLGDLQFLARGIRETSSPFLILGAGSNILASDQGFQGLVVKPSRLNIEIKRFQENRISTGAGVAVSSLLRKAAQEGWGGLEFLTGVPGSVGGVIAMNAGTHLGEAKDRARRVFAFPLISKETPQASSFLEFSGADLRFEYRRNLFMGEGDLIYAVEWEITPGDPAQVKAKIDETLARRKATQPLDYPSCGSVFKNPKEHGLHAWQVIDQLGLRGHRVGDAQFSEKHSNFIVNLGSAKSADVRALIDLAKARALNELSIPLEEEVKYAGDYFSSV